MFVTGYYCPKRCDVERRCCSDWDEGRRDVDDTGREEAGGGGVGEGGQGQVGAMYSAWPRLLVYFHLKSRQFAIKNINCALLYHVDINLIMLVCMHEVQLLSITCWTISVMTPIKY